MKSSDLSKWHTDPTTSTSKTVFDCVASANRRASFEFPQVYAEYLVAFSRVNKALPRQLLPGDVLTSRQLSGAIQ